MANHHHQDDLRVTSLMSPIADPWCRRLVDLMSAALPFSVRFVDDSEGERQRIVREGDVDIAWVCGLLHVGRSDPSAWPYHVIASPVMASGRYESRPIYFGDVVVRSDSPAKTLDEVTNGVWAYNEKSSLSGFHMVRHDLGIEPDRLSVASGSHLDSLQMVARGDADWAVIDSTAYDMVSAQKPHLISDVRVLTSIGPHPMPPLIAHVGLAAETVKQVVGTLTSIHETPEGRDLFARYRVERVVEAHEADYDAIRGLAITVA